MKLTRRISELRERIAPTLNHRSVDPSDIEAALLESMEHEQHRQLLDALDSCGAVVLAEIHARVPAVEGKAVSILGWASAAIAFFVFSDTGTNVILIGVTTLGTVVAFAAAWCSARALWVGTTEVISQRDWFRSDLFSNPGRLRVYHLLAALEDHERSHVVAVTKTRSVRFAQCWLSLSVLCLSAILVVSLADRWSRSAAFNAIWLALRQAIGQ